MFNRALVLKEWKVDANPVDSEDHYVVVHARAAGVLAWLLNLFNLAATTSLLVSSNRLEFRKQSLAGVERVLIPLESLSSTHSGYRKPWWQTIIVFIVLLQLCLGILTIIEHSYASITLTVILALFAVVLCTLLAGAYYHLNRVYIWGVTELSGARYYIPFKRSVIEGKDVTEESAEYASQIMQALIEAKAGRYMRDPAS